MIKTSRQLKDKIKNLAHGGSLKSQTLLRTYMMERFLERLAVSPVQQPFCTERRDAGFFNGRPPTACHDGY